MSGISYLLDLVDLPCGGGGFINPVFALVLVQMASDSRRLFSLPLDHRTEHHVCSEDPLRRHGVVSPAGPPMVRHKPLNHRRPCHFSVGQLRGPRHWLQDVVDNIVPGGSNTRSALQDPKMEA